jgi:serine protease Do
VTSGDLPAIIALDSPGDRIKLGIWRKDAPLTVMATLGNAGNNGALVASNGNSASQSKLGLTVRPLQGDEKQQDGVDHGVVVEDASGPAAQAGIQAGDVLLSVNGTPVNSVAEVRAVVAKSGDSVALLIQRGDNEIFVPVQLG